MTHFVAFPASFIAGWTALLFIMHSIAPLTVLFNVAMFLSMWLSSFVVAPSRVAVLSVSHLVQSCFHTLCTLLLDLLALAQELDRPLQRQIRLELQSLQNLFVRYSYYESVPDLFIITVAELAVLRQLIQAPDKRFYSLICPLAPLMEAGTVVYDIASGHKVFIEIFHYGLKIKLGVPISLCGSRKHKQTVDRLRVLSH